MSVHLRERELLAQLVAMAVVGLDVDRALEQERLIQTVQLLANRFSAASTPSISLPVDVSSIGSVADRSEIPSDLKCARRAK